MIKLITLRDTRRQRISHPRFRVFVICIILLRPDLSDALQRSRWEIIADCTLFTRWEALYDALLCLLKRMKENENEESLQAGSQTWIIWKCWQNAVARQSFFIIQGRLSNVYCLFFFQCKANFMRQPRVDAQHFLACMQLRSFLSNTVHGSWAVQETLDIVQAWPYGRNQEQFKSSSHCIEDRQVLCWKFQDKQDRLQNLNIQN